MYGTATLKSDYNMNWVDIITQIPMQSTPKSLTGAVANHALYKSLRSFRGHVMKTKLYWCHDQNGVTKFVLKQVCEFR